MTGSASRVHRRRPTVAIALLVGLCLGVVGTIFQPPLVVIAAVALGLAALGKAGKASADDPPASAYLLGAIAFGMALAFAMLVLPVLL